MKKNLYFVEVGFSFDKDIYLPYATGSIAAYLKKKGCFNEKFNLAGFIYRREPTDSIVKRIKNPDIVGFSCCIWNEQFNLVLAEKIKNLYPDCLIVFGGHNITDDPHYLRNYPFIDILISGEGEVVFYSLLENLLSDSIIKTDNISFRKNGHIISTPKAEPPDLSDFPSPYLTGIFDDILSEEDHSSLLCVLETNRGCPYSCSYCDWCAGRRVRTFPYEKVISELKWITSQNIEYCFCADSNFGIFPRDTDIAKYAAEMKNKYGYPKVFRTCFAKESNENVFNISKILNDAGMDKGATLAYQTLSEDALKNINRKNLTLEHFSDLLKKYNSADIPTYSELILGLPGETKESFCNGICRILESGQHNSLSIYYLEMLPNSEMSQKSYITKHKLQSVKIKFNHMHSSKQENEIQEYSNIVQSTASLSKDDWIYCNLFSICVQTFHSLGFLRYFALYLNKENGVSYYRFYTSLLEYILNSENTVAHSLFNVFKERLSSSLTGNWNFTSPEFGDVAWAFEEGAYLKLLKEADTSFNDFEPFLRKFFSDDELYFQLKDFQICSLRTCFVNNRECFSNYDFLTFFNEIISNKSSVLKKERIRYIFSTDKTYSDWKEFAKEIVWFGRRKGATIISGRKNSGTSVKVADV